MQNNSSNSVGIVISTYNSPQWLEKTLWGYENQSFSDFEVIIADDGSGEETKNLITQFKEKGILNISHVWQLDNGFRKSEILNKAILASNAEYLIFTDQDCIPRKDFVQTHLNYAEHGYILSGGYFKLPLNISQVITNEDVICEQAFDLQWLREQGLKRSFKNTKLSRCKSFCNFMNRVTPANASWNGCNSSGWKEDMLKINGFNEDMQYGGQDREFGERLFNMGIRSKQIRYSAICLHLYHKRPYKTKETLEKNKAIRGNTRNKRIIQTSNGIKKL